MAHILILGGGAAGLAAALAAAQTDPTARVTVLERSPRPGKKLLATGNGRCNLTKLQLAPAHYHGEAPDFAAYALSRFDVDPTLAFFRGLGLLTVAEPGGRVYPLSDQAGSVVDVLRFALDEAGVAARPAFEVTDLRKTKRGFAVSSAEETLTAEKVILCAGGLAGGKLGGSMSGYQLLESLGHRRTALYPALVQVKTDPTFVRSLKGVRADAAVSLRRGKSVLAESRGEVQFTDFGVSGPAVFEVSRAAAAGKGGLTVHLDLLRSLNSGETAALLRCRRADMPHLTTENLLTGVLHNRLGRTLVRYAGYDLTTPLPELAEADLQAIAAAVHDFALPVQGTLGFDGAQVTAGGIRTAEFDPQTLQSRLVPGLYAAGEVLDIDGDCGGYNLQWAWSSGNLAGQLLD